MKEVWIERRAGERIRVAVEHLDGTDYLDVRTYATIDGVQWSPTKRGITLSLDKRIELSQAIAAVRVGPRV